MNNSIFKFILLFYRKIKVWDLVAALDPRAVASTLCLRTLVVRHLRIYAYSFIYYIKSAICKHLH